MQSIPVNILVTCNDPDLIEGSLLVFDTLRVGFPDSPVKVHFNGNCASTYESIQKLVEDYDWREFPNGLLHHQWIEYLIETNNDPFFICDTDVIFWRRFTLPPINRAISGRLIPKFYDKFTQSITMPRLHTSLMYIDPVAVRNYILTTKTVETRFNPIINLIHPIQMPSIHGGVFYDTCALLYQAIGGQPFTEQQLDTFDHLNAGTWVNELDARWPGLNLQQAHKQVYQNPMLAKGAWKLQNRWYENNTCRPR